MRQCTEGQPRGRAWAVVAGAALAVLVLAGSVSDARAQTFNDAIQGALQNQCSGLSGVGGSYQGTLNTICTAGPPAVGTSSGASIASQALGQQGADQRRIQLRLEEQRQAGREGGVLAASADPSFQLGKLGLFVTAEGDWVKKDVTRFEPGFSSDAGGVIVGADYRVLPWLTAGLALSYLGTNGNFTSNTGHFSIDAFGVTLYGSAAPLPNLFVDGTVGYTLRDYDTVRRASYVATGNSTVVDGFVQGDTTGNEFRTSVQVGYDFPLGALSVGPRVGVNYSTNDIDPYAEHNSSPKNIDTGLQLAYDGQHRESLTTTVGAFASYAISTSIGVFVPQFTGDWVHEFYDNHFLSFRALVGYTDRQAYTANGGLRVGF